MSIDFKRQDPWEESDAKHIVRLMCQAGEGVLVAGIGDDVVIPTVVRPVRPRVSDEAEILQRIKHVLKKDEPLLAFYARTGLGRAQILQMEKKAITKFVEQAEASAKQEELSPWQQRLRTWVTSPRALAIG